jgi:long-chain fatty acid transport protein
MSTEWEPRMSFAARTCESHCTPRRRGGALGAPSTVLLAALFAGTSGPAIGGSAYEIRTQSISVLGSAQAGMTAGPYDLSRMSLNPASLGLGSGYELSIGATGVITSLTATDVSGSTVLGTPISGNSGGNAGVAAVLPNLYAAASVNQWLRLGFGATSYYGLGPAWDSNWIGRYNIISAQLRSIDLIGVASVRPTPSLIVAGGPIFENVAIRTDAAIDDGTLDQIAFNGAFGGVPGGSDGSVATRVENWAVGYIVGATWEPWEGGRIGASYRSQIHHQLNGNAIFGGGGSVGQAIAAVTGVAGSQPFSSSLTNPAVITVGIAQHIGDSLEVFADVQRLGWHSVKSLDLVFDNPAQPPVLTELNLNDTWYIAVGGRYQLNEIVAVRFGAAYDTSSTQQPNRTPLLPDADTWWLAVGLEVMATQSLRIDWAYGHVFWSGADISLSATQLGSTLRGNLMAATQTSGNFMAIQASYRF